MNQRNTSFLYQVNYWPNAQAFSHPRTLTYVVPFAWNICSLSLQLRLKVMSSDFPAHSACLFHPDLNDASLDFPPSFLFFSWRACLSLKRWDSWLNVSPPLDRGFSGSSTGKESPAMQETLVRFLGQEDPLEKG